MDYELAASTQRRQRYHHGDLRRDLLRVAREEIARSGADGLTLAVLAKRIGVSQPAPYRHFADRQALLQAVAAEAFEELTRCLSEAASREASPGEAVLTLALAYLTFGEANIERYRLMFASGLTPQAEGGTALARGAEGALDLLRQAVRKDADVTSDSEPDRHVYAVWAQLHGFVMLKADGFITSPLGSYVPILRQ